MDYQAVIRMNTYDLNVVSISSKCLYILLVVLKNIEEKRLKHEIYLVQN